MISVTQIVNFANLYSSRNITKAAETLFITRQSLSNSIISLEDELGTELFIRSNKGLVPTKSADILYRYYLKFDLMWKEMQQELNLSKTEKPLRIAGHLMYYTGEELRNIKQIVETLTGSAPVFINITDSSECWKLLENELADIVINHRPPEQSKLKWYGVAAAGTSAVMRKDDVLANKDFVDFSKDFAGRSLVFVFSEAMKDVEKMLKDQGAVCTLIESDRVLVTESILSDGTVMVIPDQCIENFLSDGLTTRPLINFPVTHGIYAIYREKTRTVEEFIKLLFNTNEI